MAQYVDCYYLIDSRKYEIGINFLDNFLSIRKESSVDYPVPIYDDNPKHIFSCYKELMRFLDENPEEEYSIYWRSLEDENIIKHGMIFYTNDNRMILGVSVEGREINEGIVIETYYKVKKFLESKVSCITVEEMPPMNSFEFREFSKQRFNPKK